MAGACVGSAAVVAGRALCRAFLVDDMCERLGRLRRLLQKCINFFGSVLSSLSQTATTMFATPSFSHDVGVACHFCHARFRLSSLQAATGWACGECEQWNGFSEFTSTGYNVRFITDLYCSCSAFAQRSTRNFPLHHVYFT